MASPLPGGSKVVIQTWCLWWEYYGILKKNNDFVDLVSPKTPEKGEESNNNKKKLWYIIIGMKLGVKDGAQI